jgi:hypothetical protein
MKKPPCTLMQGGFLHVAAASAAAQDGARPIKPYQIPFSAYFCAETKPKDNFHLFKAQKICAQHKKSNKR